MLTLPLAGANAWGPDREDYRDAVVRYMKWKHPELAPLNDAAWKFEMGPEGRILWGLIRYRDVDANGTCVEYELEWTGDATWILGFWRVHEDSYHYLDYWDIEVSKVGPGTTVRKPGTYYVRPGDDYTFRAVPSVSDDEEVFFKFRHWNITNGVTWWIETEQVLTGEATQNLWITAVFRTAYYSGCNIVYEDGLEGGYLWRDDHVLVNVRAVGSSAITITIEGDYGTFSNTWTTRVRSFNVYFRPYWFVGDYTITVTAVNGSPYIPVHRLYGLD